MVQGRQPQTEEEGEEDSEEEEEDTASETDDTQDDWIMAGRAEQVSVDEVIDTGTDQADWHVYWRSLVELAIEADSFLTQAKG